MQGTREGLSRVTIVLAVLAVSLPAVAQRMDIDGRNASKAGRVSDPTADPHYLADLDALLELAFDDAEPPFDRTGPGSAEILQAVLESDLFVHDDAGPFDVYVMMTDGLASRSKAKGVLKKATKGLRPLVETLDRHLGESGADTLVASRRFPIVIVDSDVGKGECGFDQLIALLDWCDDTGWKGTAPIWTTDLRAGLTVRTWDVQLFNLDDTNASSRPKDFLDHGLGYYTLAHVVTALMRQGTQCLATPTWLSQGLVDELDIAAYGEAWVGCDGDTPILGYYRPRSFGFVPAGQRVRPRTEVVRGVLTDERKWQSRQESESRHWTRLAEETANGRAPSLVEMSQADRFDARDRAYARLVTNLLLSVVETSPGDGLLASMDRRPTTPLSGMPDSAPLPALIATALGGLPEVERLESLPLRDLLATLGRTERVARIEQLDAAEMLPIVDHRDQAEWLYGRDADEMTLETRLELWDLIMTAEYEQQAAQWAIISETLDRAARAALAESRKFPARSKDRKKVATAFGSALAQA